MNGGVQPADAHDALKIFVRFLPAARLYGDPMLADAELLQRYARDRDQAAFAEVVRRHLGLVYASALRRSHGNTHLAEEVAQKIFVDLARKAAVLSSHPALAGWLHRSTRYAMIDAVRTEQRRQKLNETLAAMSDSVVEPETVPEWEHLRSVLDDALDELKEIDREAMLLRFFQGLSFAEVGARLRLSENAARMRTERALDKLRGGLRRRGITPTPAALGVVLANQAFAQVPAGLAASVTATALTAPPAGVVAAFFSSLLASKPAAAVVGAACASGITVLAWTAWEGGAGDKRQGTRRLASGERALEASGRGRSFRACCGGIARTCGRSRAGSRASSERKPCRRKHRASQSRPGDTLRSFPDLRLGDRCRRVRRLGKDSDLR